MIYCTFLEPINQVSKEVSCSVGVIEMSLDSLPQITFRCLHYGIVYPHILYDIEGLLSSSQMQLNRHWRLLDIRHKLILRNIKEVYAKFFVLDKKKYKCTERMMKNREIEYFLRVSTFFNKD